MPATVLSSLDAGIRTIALNRPDRLNAINTGLLNDLHTTLAEAHADPATRAIILRGEGRAFCAGDDLKEFGAQTRTPEEARAHVERIQHITRDIMLGEKIVIGAIHGWAVGGGLEWVLNCDLVIMAESCRCFCPETALGVFVTGGASALLPRLMGMQKAKALILFGEKITAAQALDLGIAWRVAPDERLWDEANTVAEQIARLPEKAVRDVKRVLNRAATLDLEGALALETEAALAGFLDPETAGRVGSALG